MLQQTVKAVVVGVRMHNDQQEYDLSLRASRMEPSAGIVPKDRELSKLADITPDDIVRGYVSHVGDNGVFVALVRSSPVYILDLFSDAL